MNKNHQFHQELDLKEGKLNMSTNIFTMYEACEQGNLEIVQNFLNSNEANSYTEISGYQMLISCIRGGHLEIFKAIFNSSFKPNITFDPYNWETYGSQMCIYDRFDMLQFMLDHPNFLNNKIDSFMAILPRGMASHGRLDMLQYILEKYPNDPAIKANIVEGDILIHAARQGNFNILEYIFTNDGLKEQIDIHIYKDEAFRVAYQNNQMDVIKYFIFDLNIEKTQDILNHDKDNTILKMFETRELNKSLTKELKDNIINTKKAKL